jgi:hypothetical protein
MFVLLQEQQANMEGHACLAVRQVDRRFTPMNAKQMVSSPIIRVRFVVFSSYRRMSA